MRKIKWKILTIIIITFCVILAGAFVVNADSKEIVYVARTYIDYPTNNNVSGNMVVEGWIMTNDTEAMVKAYVDGIETEVLSQTRSERIDVLNAITGYGTIKENPMPGIRLILDTSKLSEGSHNLIINVFSRDGILLTGDARTFTYEKEKARMYIDEPLSDGTIIKDDYEIKGWKMSNDVNSKIKVYIDDNIQETKNLSNIKRPDVIKAIVGYGSTVENEFPGFEFKLDVNKINDGIHTLKIQILSEDDNILTEDKKQIIIQKYVARTYIDYPTNNSMAGSMTLDGWVMTNDEQAVIKICVDDIEQREIEMKRIERDDVLKAISGYGTANETPLPGVICDIDISRLTLGMHQISLQVFSREGNKIAQSTSTFNVEEPKAKIYIDTATKGSNIIYKDNIFDGWIMSNNKNAKIKVYIDEQEQEMNKKLNEVSSKKNSTRSSWQLELSSFSLIAQTADFLWSF